MGISSISGVGRALSSTADTAAPATAVRQTPTEPVVEFDQVTQQPVPPRFPWLSRLSQELESASRQKPAFASAPVLGDHVDKSA